MTLRDRLKNSAPVIFLGAIVAGFVAGFASYKAVTEAQGQTLVLKTRLQNYEEHGRELAEAKIIISELESIASKQQMENAEEEIIRDKLSLANARIEQLEQTVADQLEKITENVIGETEDSSDGKDLGQSTSSTNEINSFEVIDGKQEFSMAAGELKAIGDSSMLLTVNSIQSTAGIATYSNLSRDISASTVRMKQAVPIMFFKGCSVIPIKFVHDADGKRVNFVSEC